MNNSLFDVMTKGFPDHFYLRYGKNGFFGSKLRGPLEESRRVLALVFDAFISVLEKDGIDREKASRLVRMLWQEHSSLNSNKIPLVISEEAFLNMYAEGACLKVGSLKKMSERLKSLKTSHLNPILIGFNAEDIRYFDVRTTPPGFLPKLFSSLRKKKDQELLKYIQSDLDNLASLKDKAFRKWITLAILSHGAVYREIEGAKLHIPSLTGSGKKIPYVFEQHLLWEGIKTVSCTPLENQESEPGIYLCQGTEIWPSQPLVLSSIFANLGSNGSATEPYAYSSTQINYHLSRLGGSLKPKPLVSGHSMGAALATQIALYSHDLIECAYAFNPPVVEKRDYDHYHQFSPEIQDKLRVYASIDDLPFWRMGSKVIGRVTLLLGEKRWMYYPLHLLDVLLVLPLLVKVILNIFNSIPAHQSIIAFLGSFVTIQLTPEEIEKENEDRKSRFDRIHFFPFMHRLMRFLVHYARSHTKWELKKKYLENQLELVALQEEAIKNREPTDSQSQLDELKKQRSELIEKLKNL